MTEEEFYNLEVGSIVLFGKSKTERIVRKISICTNNRSQDYGKPVWIYFVIKRCSWTHRPYTLYLRHEIMRLCEYTGIKVSIPEWEKILFEQEARSQNPAQITCCHVKGYN